ncbi:hypothetical protein CYMTET_11238 [Cymbomonas tetramitiformis]|uniref:Uncharacterized protein n=1 Tax=Cymbomonas tetramitiformis TaxID=36881 RepID=A0AAE0GMX0_9CHLO|nr:hypothetical protein CYMTET_11238 [Cymbomonas tetramitiformis]
MDYVCIRCNLEEVGMVRFPGRHRRAVLLLPTGQSPNILHTAPCLCNQPGEVINGAIQDRLYIITAEAIYLYSIEDHRIASYVPCPPDLALNSVLLYDTFAYSGVTLDEQTRAFSAPGPLSAAVRKDIDTFFLHPFLFEAPLEQIVNLNMTQLEG